MLYFNPHDLRQQVQAPRRILGIDPGSKQLGLALTDVQLILASPFKTIKRQKLSVLIQEFNNICKAQDVAALVIGLPLSLDGTDGPAAHAARDWGKDLAERLNLPYSLWDERLSSSAVNRFLVKEMDLTRKKRNEVVDKLAASYILQGWLDATAQRKTPAY
ncbi:Holliday junction resolvase RuvX [Aristophania vespae]|uniref:Putative pre-16S rRNA nuclease n=1 Tax=Aristophania vespae TaxID=2697033 RepID=A0A6P1NA84_9PROT|nr:Holliday junction resolvase RuvX [Aristophania vespae]QHI95555.1 Holliday junction resolvase RuvX [Aristophania vespae]